MAKNGNGNINRTKGHNAERLYAKLFKEFGFSHCVTSRYGSRLHDDAGIDLINIPINVQIKAGKQKSLNPSQVLHDISSRIKTFFPKDAREHDLPTIIIHHKEVGKGKKRNDFDTIVHMSFKDFEKLLNMIEW